MEGFLWMIIGLLLLIIGSLLWIGDLIKDIKDMIFRRITQLLNQ